jgi:hypothetical protein
MRLKAPLPRPSAPRLDLLSKAGSVFAPSARDAALTRAWMMKGERGPDIHGTVPNCDLGWTGEGHGEPCDKPICGFKHDPLLPQCEPQPKELSPLSTQMRTASALNSVGLWFGNARVARERLAAGSDALYAGYGIHPAPWHGAVLLVFVLVAIHLLRVHARIIFTLLLLFLWAMLSS